MENSLEKVQKRVDSLNSKKELLIQSLGRENFESIVDEVNKIIKKHNLNTTPTILKDLMDYVVNATFITDFEVPDQKQLIERIVENVFKKYFEELSIAMKSINN